MKGGGSGAPPDLHSGSDFPWRIASRMFSEAGTGSFGLKDGRPVLIWAVVRRESEKRNRDATYE